MTRDWTPRPQSGQTVVGSVVFGDIIQITGVGGDVTVSLDRPPYRVTAADLTSAAVSVDQARDQPSQLLLAQHQVVPFTGRDRTLDDLAAWVSGTEPVTVKLIHAAGGHGKTRLATYVSTQCAAAGWAVWQFTHTRTPVPGSLGISRVALPGGAVLAVVDYADRWPASALIALLTQLRDLNLRAATTVRVLMLARSSGYWWPAVASAARSTLRIDVQRRPPALPALAADGGNDRPALFSAAATKFAAALDLPPADWPVPDLSGSNFTQVLATHMAALATVDAIRRGRKPPTNPEAASAYLLEREEAYWYALHTRAEDPLPTPPAMMHRTVFAATLTGAQPRTHAQHILATAGFADTRATADQIIDDHTTCYPPSTARTVFEPLHPDRLGEDLLALSTPGHDSDSELERDWTTDTFTALLDDTQPSEWNATAVTVLVETARRWPHIATNLLYPFARQHPEQIIAAGGATITRLASIPDIGPDILQALEPLLPSQPHIDLDIAAAAVSSVLTPYRLARTTDPAEQANLHAAHGYRLANAGQREQALAPAEEAVTIRRRLAEQNPDAYLPDLAASLNNIGTSLSELGRREQALAPAEEATGIYRRLAEQNPDAYLPDLAGSLNNLGTRLSGLGRREQALAPAEEAVTIRRRLAEQNPDAYLPHLAASLNNLGTRLSGLGRREQALAPTEEAVTIRRRLAEQNPDAYLPHLAASLNNLGIRLSGLGRREQALAPAEEATGIYRRLAEQNPDAYLPHLAASLNNLGIRLSELGRREQALAPAEEATGIYRRLAEQNPDAYLPDLAMSLWAYGLICVNVKANYAQALESVTEAISLYKSLAEQLPDMFLGQLSSAYRTLADVLEGLGRANEAANLRRQLDQASSGGSGSG
ncbi:tetratricopeptide repeat protein [Actinoplanes oblitus]|uniref:Tetratricopeptide repeat protein n=1 Tax=Actinoplanes oblitus TaxID=3040509 RepID=A0ABY8WQJ2_9ACTN|nr:tetratricopeptide repeat protein [Actinoplanes oblitus]WIN00121.1 tetratricopeptide repeat protein [Actinoplanes oblitus]